MFANLAIGIFLAAAAQFEPAAVFSDHAVLLRSKDTPIFGYAAAGEKVKVSIAGVSAEAKTDADGKWLARLDLTAVGNGPFELKMNDVVARDVLVGEVWLCSGQSNMDFTMITSDDSETERKYSNGWLRCYFTYGKMSATEQCHVKGRWMCHMDEWTAAWSAVGYHFAKYLGEGLNRPVGFVCAAKGASTLEAWIDPKDFENAPAAARAALAAEVNASKDYPNYERYCEAARARWAAAKGRGDRQPVDPATLEWKKLSAKELYDFTRWGGAYWFRCRIPLAEPGKAHRVDYARFVERIWTFNLAKVEVYWNGQRLVERRADDPIDVHNRCFDVPPEAAKAENELLVRAYDCDSSRQLPFTFMLDGNRLPEDGWQVADEFDLGRVPAEERATMPTRQSHRLKQNFPFTLYNGMIASLVPMGLSGVIWYQGESNARIAMDYYAIFPAFIEHWRRIFGNPQLPFGWCQLAAWGTKTTDANMPLVGPGDWPHLRDAQDKALALPMTGQAVLLDVGEECDIHPRDKRTPGRRLANWALNCVYGQKDVVYLGPRATAATAEGSAAVVKFIDVTGGLIARDLGETYIVRSSEKRYGKVARNSPRAAVEGFSVCDADGKWHWADEATIEGDAVKVTAKAVARPMKVRYGWAQNPWVNLFNGAGLPAVPFEMEVR